MEQVTLVLSNVTIISRESPICYILIKKTTRSKKGQALHWKYDAIDTTFEWHEEGASGNLSNVWQKNIYEVSDMQEACLFQEWKEHD
jgi:hypothetical protein